MSHPTSTSPRHRQPKLFNDGFRQRQPLLITRSYLHAGFIADTLEGAASKAAESLRKLLKKQVLLIFCSFPIYRNGCETVSLIIIWIHDHGCSADDSHFITFNSEDLSGAPQIFNHATLKFPRNRRPVTMRFEWKLISQ